MLNIKCDHCGATLKGSEVVITSFKAYVGNVKYTDYATTCPKCNGSVVYERITYASAKNRAKAIIKSSQQTGKSFEETVDNSQYDDMMRGICRRAKDIASSYKDNPVVSWTDMCKSIHELSKSKKKSLLAYEDKQDMALLKSGTKRDTKHIEPHSILLLTQGIIELAIAEKDKDFFKSEYGAQIVDTYNLALTAYKHHDYGITAEFLLNKMRKGEIHVKGDE